MLVQSNPVSRLVSIIESAGSISPNARLKEVWAKTLGCEPSDTAEVLRLMGELILLAGKAKKAVLDIENIDVNLYVAPFKGVEALLSNMNFDKRWHEVATLVDPQTLMALKFAADLLKREGVGSFELSDTQVDELMTKLDEILDRVLKSSLPTKLKQLFARNLEQLRQTLISLKISGVEGVEQEIDRALGSAFRHTAELKEIASQSEENAAVIKDYFGVLSNINETITFGQNLAMIAAPVTPLLVAIFS